MIDYFSELFDRCRELVEDISAETSGEWLGAESVALASFGGGAAQSVEGSMAGNIETQDAEGGIPYGGAYGGLLEREMELYERTQRAALSSAAVFGESGYTVGGFAAQGLDYAPVSMLQISDFFEKDSRRYSVGGLI